MFVSFPLARLLSEVIRLSSWTEHGVAKDAAGHRDMVGAPVLGVGLTQDGASLMAADLGCVIEALKFTGYHMFNSICYIIYAICYMVYSICYM
ncbi:hypothetical protein B484DRAFT_460780, partial [Ochromonadaceae sp. CCMP2298]